MYCQVPLYLIFFYRIYCHIMTHRIVTYQTVYYHVMIPRILIYLVLLINLCCQISIPTHFLSLHYSRYKELILLTIPTFILVYTNGSCHIFYYSSSSFCRFDSTIFIFSVVLILLHVLAYNPL